MKNLTNTILSLFALTKTATCLVSIAYIFTATTVSHAEETVTIQTPTIAEVPPPSAPTDSPPTDVAQDKQKQIDLNKVNAVIEEIIQSSIKSDEVIREVHMKFDPSSNIPTGNVDLQFSAKVATTPWANNENSDFSLQLGTQFKDLILGQKQGTFKLGAQANTQVLAMIRLIGKKLLTESDGEEGNEKDYKHIIKKISEVENLNQLMLSLEELKEAILQSNIADSDKEYIRSITITATTVDDQIEMLRVEMTKPLRIDFFKPIEIQAPTLIIGYSNIQGSLNLITWAKEDEFYYFVESAQEYLSQLQVKTPAVVEKTTSMVENYIRIVKDYLKETKPAEE